MSKCAALAKRGGRAQEAGRALTYWCRERAGLAYHSGFGVPKVDQLWVAGVLRQCNCNHGQRSWHCSAHPPHLAKSIQKMVAADCMAALAYAL